MNDRLEIREDIKKAHRGLSECSVKFLEYVERNPEGLIRSNFDSLLLNEHFTDKLIQPWPTFVNRKMKREMEYAAVQVCKLIKSIPRRIFAYDFQKISDYYEIPKDLVELIFYGVDDDVLENLFSRGDFILSADRLNCIEYNMQSNLGGWEVDLLETFYVKIPIISKFLKDNDIRIWKSNFFPIMLEQLIDRALSKFSNDTACINIALVLQQYTELHVESYLKQLYKRILRQKKQELRGEIIVCQFDQIDIVDDCLYYKKKRIHIVIERTNGFVNFLILHAAKKGNILLYNGPISVIMSNKLNLALLSEHENSDIFTLQEREVIKKYIPWTRKIIPGFSTYEGREIQLIDFILSYKDKLIIKPADKLGGEGVQLGCKVSGMQWERLVQEALVSKNWVIQEYVDPIYFLYQSSASGCAEHQVVWGFFIFGSQYTFAGGTVRMLPGKSNKGIINVGQGAEKTIIIEVEE